MSSTDQPDIPHGTVGDADAAAAAAAAAGEPSRAPVPMPAPVQAIRFCRTCGLPWDVSATECAHCAQRGAASATVAQAQLAYDSDRRRIRSATWLYFSLLAVSSVMIAAVHLSGEK